MGQRTLKSSQLKDMDFPWKDISDGNMTLKSYWLQWDSFIIEHGRLKRIRECFDGATRRYQIVAQSSEVSIVLKKRSNGSSEERFDIRNTLRKVNQRDYWRVKVVAH